QEMMIKRLTDDPMKLNDALPGGAFPPRLQEVMDRALARMPTDRYTSAAQFARDAVRAIQGMADVAPSTIAEGATQMINSAEAVNAATVAKTRLSDRTQGIGTAAPPPAPAAVPAAPVATPPAKKRPARRRKAEAAAPAPVAPPPPPSKKKPVLVIAVAAGVLVVGGVTAGIMLWSRNGTSGIQTDTVATDVSPDTARRVVAGNTQGTTQPVVRPPQPATSTSPPPATAPGPTNTTPITTPVAKPSADSAAIDRELEAILDQVIEEPTRAGARERARQIYGDVAVPTRLRAQAASYVAQAYQEDRNTPEACKWVANARNLAPINSHYSQLQQRMGCTP
ncbi:MAG: hypothetical protein L0Y54_22110, partial [Sporichthyaceae bacterium]|nr:hypothetical protein [Sporichthyaceae bacterium]